MKSIGEDMDMLAKKIRDIDQYQTGYINQTNFKNLISKLGFSFTLT